ncbi:MAG: hypothetical protein IJH39_05770 [Clostridia bacterium]|nr:hypothetical protein [Clostridia bacterium]
MYNLKQDRLTIFDVINVSTKEVLDLINKLRKSYPNYEVFNRTNKSFLNEFYVHKLCYKLYILRKKTKDAGMQYPLSPFINLLYSIFGPISKLFVK